MTRKNIETITPPNEKSTEAPRKLGASAVLIRSGHYEHGPTATSLFQRDENGFLRFEDGIYGAYDLGDDEELGAACQHLEESLSDTLGDLDSLDLETVTLEQVRQAFGGLKENFSLHDVFDVIYILGDTKLRSSENIRAKISFMQSMLEEDYATRLVKEAKQHLESKDSQPDDLSFIFRHLYEATSLQRDNQDVAEVTLGYLKKHFELLKDKNVMFRLLQCFSQYESTREIGTHVIVASLSQNNPEIADMDEVTKGRLMESTVHYFELYYYTDRDLPNIRNNYETLIDIEKEVPGITTFLEEELGVVDFGRYPRQLLIDQYAQKDDDESPYGVLLYPDSDHNGAFHGNKQVLQGFYEKLQALGVNLRISERDGKVGAARSLLRFKKIYGHKQRISFAILGGHGSENSIRFGDDHFDTNSYLRTEDLTGRGVQRSLGSEFFIEKPTIILNSCSTGVPEGIGQNISEMTGGDLIAPDRPTNLSNIEVTQDEDKKLHFKVSYGSGEGVDIRYVGGQEVPDLE